MAKYARLNQEELKLFEEDFVKFLVVNGIDAKSWEKMQSDEPQKAERMIDLFSDMVYEIVLQKTEYLVNALDHTAFLFKFESDKATLIVIRDQTGQPIQLENVENFIQLLAKEPARFIADSQQKAYKKNREIEMMELIRKGCLIDEGKLFTAADSFWTAQSN